MAQHLASPTRIVIKQLEDITAHEKKDVITMLIYVEKYDYTYNHELRLNIDTKGLRGANKLIEDTCGNLHGGVVPLTRFYSIDEISNWLESTEYFDTIQLIKLTDEHGQETVLFGSK